MGSRRRTRRNFGCCTYRPRRAQVARPTQAGQEAPHRIAAPLRPLPAAPVAAGYNAGHIASPAEKIGGLLLGEDIPADLMVELLPAMLWLEHATGLPTNLCVSSCAALHFAYAQLGIDAHPRAVDLVVGNRRTDQHTMYGQSDPYWSGSTFHGHCVLWVPGSKRLIDPTVEQYPEIRRYELGPVCGRIAASMATPAQQAELARGELPPGTAIGVERQDLILLYTTVDPEFDDIVMSAPGHREQPRRDPARRQEPRSHSPSTCCASPMYFSGPDVLRILVSEPYSICWTAPKPTTTTMTNCASSCAAIHPDPPTAR